MSLSPSNHNVKRLANRIVPILKKGGVIEASIFGSFARGDEGPESDLDLLVKYKGGTSLFDVCGLQYELEQVLERKVDLVSKDHLKPRLKHYILQDHIRIL